MNKYVFFKESCCPMFTSTHILIVIIRVLIVITCVVIMCANCFLRVFLIFAMALIVRDIYIVFLTIA